MARIAMFVLNDVSSDARVLREAGSLASAGHEVVIMGRPADPLSRLPETEARPGFTIRRVPIPGRVRRMLLRHSAGRTIARSLGPGPAASVPSLGTGGATHAAAPPERMEAGTIARAVPVPFVGDLMDGGEWLLRWRLGVAAWCRAAAAAAPPADVWHAHDLDTLEAAWRARAAHGGRLVYDCHEVFLESGSHARRPPWARRVLARRERRWGRDADLVITVNESLADDLQERLGRRPVIVRNTPPAWTPPEPPPDLLRERLGLAAGTPLVLYHGGFLPDRGLPELIAALGEPGLERAHLVLLGSGPLEPLLAELAAAPAAGGRVHLLAPVPPDALLAWVASADVAAMPNQPRTRNERLSTPNKLFEALAAGVPVVSSDFPERRHILLDDPEGPLGRVCDPTDRAALAAALRELLDLPPAERAALRARILRAAHARYTWEAESARLLEAYRPLLEDR